MGYIMALVLTVIVVAALFGPLLKSGRTPKHRRRRAKSVTFSQPSADAPTPGASRISAAKARAALRHTPSA